MIRLTRLNNRPLVVNSELIKFIENAPDTVITLVTGEKIVVLETAEEVIARIVEYRRRLRKPVTAVPPLENPVKQPDQPEVPEKTDQTEESFEDGE
jgi:flagellar protein FlbD